MSSGSKEPQHHDDGSITVAVDMPDPNMRAEVRVGLTDDGRLQVWAVSVMPSNWTGLDDITPPTSSIASADMREVPLSAVFGAAIADERFRYEAQQRANQAHGVFPERIPDAGRGKTYKTGELVRIARHYLSALRSDPRRAVIRVQEMLADEDTERSLPAIRDRLRICYERGYLIKIETPGKAGAVAGPNLPPYDPASDPYRFAGQPVKEVPADMMEGAKHDA